MKIGNGQIHKELNKYIPCLSEMQVPAENKLFLLLAEPAASMVNKKRAMDGPLLLS